MNKAKIKDFKRGLANDLRGLAETLRIAGILRDTSPLDSAAAMCTTNLQREDWKYDCLGLQFLVSQVHLAFHRRTIPGNLSEMAIELSVQAGGKYTELHDSRDPFTLLEVNCVIEGRQATGTTYYCAWHLDRNQDENTEQESAEFAHPRYHFQFWGDRLPADLGYGRSLLLKAPRIAHPPLDAILAIDFVLSNYYPGVWRDLRDDAKYARIIQAAQRRIWLPYSMAAGRWNGLAKSKDMAWSVKDVWPQAIP